MNSKISPIRGKASQYAGEGDNGSCVQSVAMPVADNGMALIEAECLKLGILQDQRALWMAYPNLQVATEKLMAIFSHVWPSAKDYGRSAVGVAAVQALNRVREGVDRGENTRTLVVANYLGGLASIAEDAVAVRAWGCQKGKAVEEWSSEASSFLEWSREGRFTEVRFYSRSDASRVETEGTRMKLLCAIATARDVGAVTRGH